MDLRVSLTVSSSAFLFLLTWSHHDLSQSLHLLKLPQPILLIGRAPPLLHWPEPGAHPPYASHSLKPTLGSTPHAFASPPDCGEAEIARCHIRSCQMTNLAIITLAYRGRLDPIIWWNWNPLNELGYLTWNLTFHHFSKFTYKFIYLKFIEWEMEMIL